MTSTPDGAGDPKRQRVGHDEAARRLLEATIELLRTDPIPEVTTRRVAERAGLHIMTIQRSFGDQRGLFIEVARELARRFAAGLETNLRVDQLFNPDLVLRSKLMAWLLDSGADPADLAPDPDLPITARLNERQQLLGRVSPRSAAAMNALAMFATQGVHVFSPVHPIDDAGFADLAILIAAIRIALPDIEKRLGWDES